MGEDGKVTVLLSGKGSNLKALIQHQYGYRINHVISDKADAGGLILARDAKIPTSVVSREEYPSLSAFKEAVRKTVADTQPGLVALAGFMVIVPPAFVESFDGRLINIHPSLLPNFPGLHTHDRALQEGAQEHGCTVHFVDAGMDTGPLIAQAKVPVLKGDTSDSLAARVLVQEHALYPWVVKNVVQGGIRLEGHSVIYSETVRAEATTKNFIIF